jgi:hypothetical protein
MSVLLTYHFILEDGAVLRGAALRSKVQPEECQPEFPGSDIRCDLERVEIVILSDARFAPKIFWSDEVFGANGNAQLLLDEREGVPLDIALIELTPSGPVWIMRSEPTTDDRIGMTVSNSKGKVLFAGIGDLTPVELLPLKKNLKPRKGHVVTFGFHEIYKWRRASLGGTAHTTGSVRHSSPAAFPDYGVAGSAAGAGGADAGSSSGDAGTGKDEYEEHLN